MSCDMNCEEGTGSRLGGAGGVAMALRALESPDWPQLTLAVLGRNGTRREVVQRLAAMLDQRAGRDGREKPDGDADTGERGLTERVRRILDMWPRYEDGEPVMPGDKVHYASTHNDEAAIEVESITVMDGLFVLCDGECRSNQYEQGQRVKRPVQSVLDADGVEIKVGDTVYGVGRSQHSFDVIDPHHIDPEVGEAFSVRCYDRDEHEECHCKPKLLTHTRPDSWERLEKDAGEDPFRYCKKVGKRLDTFDNAEVFKSADIVSRAKALAGVEVAE